MTLTEEVDDLVNALDDVLDDRFKKVFIGINEYGSEANVVEALFTIARAIEKLAQAVKDHE